MVVNAVSGRAGGPLGRPHRPGRMGTSGQDRNETDTSIVAALIRIAIIGILSYQALDRLIPQEAPEDGQPPGLLERNGAARGLPILPE